MALIGCPECGKEISDRANSCPHCGYTVESAELINCPECGKEISGDADSCPNCGYPLESGEPEALLNDQNMVLVSLICGLIPLLLMLIFGNDNLLLNMICIFSGAIGFVLALAASKTNAGWLVLISIAVNAIWIFFFAVTILSRAMA